MYRVLRYNGSVTTIPKTITNHFDDIERHLAHAESIAKDDEAYVHLLDRVILLAKSRRMTARMRLTAVSEGKKPAGPVIEFSPTEDQQHKFSRDEKVWTKDGHIGHVVGYDKKGRVVVNVIWQACEYAEADLRLFDNDKH